MKRYLFDIETNGLLATAWSPRSDPVSKLHCACIIDVDTDEEWKYRLFLPAELRAFLARLDEADMLLGHNVVDYDFPVLALLANWQPRHGVAVVDTLVSSRMAYQEFRLYDLNRKLRVPPPNPYTPHTLEEWGVRLGYPKGDFGKGTDWQTYTPEMLEYCVRDVRVNVKLFHWLVKHSKYSVESMMLESGVSRILLRQRTNGVRLNIRAAEELAIDLAEKQAVMEDQLREAFPPWYVKNGKDPVVNPKIRRVMRKNTPNGVPIVAEPGCPYSKIKVQELKPGSRFHVTRCLKLMHGWIPSKDPSKRNKDGSPKVDRKILRDLPWAEAHMFADWEELQKKISMISTGDKAWLKKVTKAGLLHGKVNPSGTKTGRMSHTNPNCGQVPKVGKPYGRECRELFGPTRPGWHMLGVDASGLELRELGHYMAKHDGGAFSLIVLDGDPHTEFMAGTQIIIRDNQKTWTYAFIYGAGDEKLGSIIWLDLQMAIEQGLTTRKLPPFKPSVLKKLGKRSRAGLEEKLPALKLLKDKLKRIRKKRGHIKLPDGRLVFLGSDHSALNMLLQGAGAIVMKVALLLLDDALQGAGLKPGVHYEFMLNVHDEFQLEFKPDGWRHEMWLRDMAEQSIAAAGRYFSMRIPLAGEAKVGANWAETH